MTLIRGGYQSHVNCPVCLVDSKNLSKLEDHAALRSQEAMMDVLKLAAERNKTNAEALLKKYGLRNLAVSSLCYIRC